jgi:hypothetical protein
MLGLYDSVDKLWMGSEEGPLLYEDPQLAKIAAMIVDRALGQPMGRTRAIPCLATPVRIRDTKPILTDPVTALGKLEEGE